jgi:hypothetical protein
MWYKIAQQLQLPGLDVEKSVPKSKEKSEPKAKSPELLETQKEPQSLFFSDWAKDHYVPEQPVYHGTTHEFDRFDINKGVSSNAFGQGFYFTNDEQDATKNYTGSGLDQKLKISDLEFKLIEEYDHDENYLWNLYGDDPRYEDYFKENGIPYNLNYLVAQIAKDTVLGLNKPRVIPAHIRMKNPFHLTSEDDTEHPEKTFNDDTDETLEFLNENDVDESDNNSYKTAILKLYNILMDYMNSDRAYQICEDLIQFTTGSVNGVVSAVMMMDSLRGDLATFDNDEESDYKGEIIQRFVNSLGHDSIIMNPNEFFRLYSEDKPIKHYITWDPENIKHARENLEFNPRNPVITAKSGRINLWKNSLL